MSVTVSSSGAEPERWPKPPPYQGIALDGPWWCGGCGGIHGWHCPYRDDPERMRQDKMAGVGAFAYGPYPGGQLKS